MEGTVSQIINFRILIWILVLFSYQKRESFDDYLLIFLRPIFHCNAKPLALGRRVGLDPQRDLFALETPTCWYPKANAKHYRPTQTLKDPTRIPHGPNASQWNIVHVGSPCIGACVGHVHFMLFCVNFIRFE